MRGGLERPIHVENEIGRGGSEVKKEKFKEG